jgi:hypothetical protein
LGEMPADGNEWNDPKTCSLTRDGR